MSYRIFIFAFLFSFSALAFSPIESVTLKNPVVSAGEALDLHFETKENFSVEPNSSMSIYLGFIEQNIFINSGELTRMSEPTGENSYRITNLTVNPWAYPRLELYTIQQIIFYEKDTFEMHSLYKGAGNYYYDDDGDQTEIPVIKFKVLPNSKSDIAPPVITQFSVSKSEIFVDETFNVSFSASDAISGLSKNILPAVMLPGQNLMNLELNWDGANQFQLKGVKIEYPERLPEDGIVPLQFMLPDNGANTAFLIIKEPDDQFYTDSNGALTTIPVVYLKIKP
ncbi:MAG: hypothetical protein V4596_10105 [Bdellovibrionota bacterium]